MAPDETSPRTTEIEDRLQEIGRYSQFVKAGLGIILGAFLLAAGTLLPQTGDSIARTVDTLLLPLIFVGMGLLLFGIGMHLHLMHLNVVRQLRMDPDSKSETSTDDRES